MLFLFWIRWDQHIHAWLGIPIFGSDFWEPHWKQISYSVFDSEDSGRKIFLEFRCWKIKKSEFWFQIQNSKKKRMCSIHLNSQKTSIVIGQLVGPTMPNHMDVGIIPGKGNLCA